MTALCVTFIMRHHCVQNGRIGCVKWYDRCINWIMCCKYCSKSIINHL